MTRPRIAKIAELYGVTLIQGFPPNGRNRTPLQAVEYIASFDPTSGKSCTQWLVKTAISKGLRFEDLERAKNALVAFERYKHRLSQDSRQLDKLKILHQLEAIVYPFVQEENQRREELDLSTAKGREKKRLEREKARQESHILREDHDGFIAIVPMTPFAAQWWGRGTKWCTTMANGEWFYHYHQVNPIIIAMLSDGRKFQMHIDDNYFQFMDAQDRPVTVEEISATLETFRPLLDYALSKCPRVLKHLPEDYLPEEDYAILLRKEPDLVYGLPESKKHLLDQVTCQKAVKQRPGNLAFIPDEFKDEQMCLNAVLQETILLRAVPKQMLSKDMVLQTIAKVNDVSHNSWMYNCAKCIPEEWLHDISFITEALSRNPGIYTLFPFNIIPEHFWPAILKISFRAIDFMPIHLCHQDNILHTLADIGQLGQIPEDKRTYEMCMTSVCCDGKSLVFVPTSFMDAKLINTMLKNNLNIWDMMLKLNILDILSMLTTEQIDCIDNDNWKRIIKYCPLLFLRIPKQRMTRALCCYAACSLHCTMSELKNFMTAVTEHIVTHQSINFDELTQYLDTKLYPRRHNDIASIVLVYLSCYEHDREGMTKHAAIPVNNKLFYPTVGDVVNKVSSYCPAMNIEKHVFKILGPVVKGFDNIVIKFIARRRWKNKEIIALKNALHKKQVK
jgi:hypothetical protein